MIRESGDTNDSTSPHSRTAGNVSSDTHSPMRNHRITLRFYEELNDFLPIHQRKQPFDAYFELPRSVKDLIESLGVPHVEVDLILVNGESVDFDCIVGNGDVISVYPMFESLALEGFTRLRPQPLRTPRFILDVHLRTLARKLRMLGFDTRYSNAADDEELAAISSTENRILLTRDLGLLKRSVVQRGLFVRETDPEKQIIEILDRLDLSARINPFTRCIRCNGAIVRVDATSIAKDGKETDTTSQIPESVRKWCKEFHRCDSCEKYYWKGSHYEHMLDEVARIKNRLSKSD